MTGVVTGDAGEYRNDRSLSVRSHTVSDFGFMDTTTARKGTT
jgi:hypothetical protein